MHRSHRFIPVFFHGSVILMLCLGGMPAMAAAEDPGTAQIQAFTTAFAGDDAQVKRQAVKALASKTVGSNRVVLPLLVAQVDDRQASEAVIAAIIARTGATVPPYGRAVPGADPARIKTAWQGWLTEWQEKQKVADLAKKVEEKSKGDGKKDKKEQDDAESTKKSASEAAGAGNAPVDKPVASAPPTDLGKLDRIVFKTGGSMVCFIQSKRVDADGNLASLRVVHPDGGGEETLSAELISRIEEDLP